MTPAHAEEHVGFLAVLAASGRSPTIPESMDVYGWLVGSWELEVRRYWGNDVTPRGLKGEVHFGWVLAGLAHHLEESGGRALRGADRPPDWL